MKRVWEKPSVTAQEFVPQEYFAVCGYNPVTKKWIFVCDAPEGSACVETEPFDGTKWTTKAPAGAPGTAFTPCYVTHETDTKPEYITWHLYHRPENGEDYVGEYLYWGGTALDADGKERTGHFTASLDTIDDMEKHFS